MANWQEFERAAPDLAAVGKERIDRFGFVFVGTVTQHGWPRISAVEAYLIESHLVFNMMNKSLKARDLLRDPRCFMHTPVLNRDGEPAEFKARGRALEIVDRRLWLASADHIEDKIQWRPPERSHSFTMEIDRASTISYENDGTQRVIRWREGGRVVREEYPLELQ